MKKWLLFVLVVQCGVQSIAQYKVRFIVTESGPVKRENVFISGTFNNWDSAANKNYLLSEYGNGKRSIELNLPAGIHRYKYTGGNWRTVEKAASSNERPDRKINLTRDTTITDTVLQWRDLFLQNMHQSIAQAADDTTKLGLLATLVSAYSFNSDFFNTDSTLYYIQQSLRQLQVIKSSNKLRDWKGYTRWLLYIQELNAAKLHALGNYPKSLELRLENLKLAKNEEAHNEVFGITANLIDDYISMKDFSNALSYCEKLRESFNRLQPDDSYYVYGRDILYHRTAVCYYNLEVPDSALYYASSMYKLSTDRQDPFGTGTASGLLGDIYSKKKMADTAFRYYRTAAATGLANIMAPIYFRSLEGMAKLFKQQGQIDSALHYARAALDIIQHNKVELQVWGEDARTYQADISPLIAELYKSNHQLDSAYKYLHLSVLVKDSLYNVTKEREFQNLSFNESMKQLQLEQQSREAQQQYETKMKMYGLVAVIAGVMVLAFILYRNNKHKQKANLVLLSQKREIEATLGELKNTQRQLIQSEKMASLGELTAGIAHEIQNPLNFVNNFSEVNRELVEELQQELRAGKIEQAVALSNDIKDNEEKIGFHGKRADGIVKNMLQHSSRSLGRKEPTDINALADEYLRLAYHGLRAKDKSFNATLKTEYDKNIGNISVIPQDIGRVVLNLINNAFYAVGEKKKEMGNKYEPVVSVTTAKQKSKVEIRVSDNGKGISPGVLDKIFQPFFTTKPTGQGTGLGLSLSYDIVKAHGGELKVETKEGEGSSFIIQLEV